MSSRSARDMGICDMLDGWIWVYVGVGQTAVVVEVESSNLENTASMYVAMEKSRTRKHRLFERTVFFLFPLQVQLITNKPE